jgi:hypothetical protein
MRLKIKDLPMCWAVFSFLFVIFFGSFLAPKNETIIIFQKKDYKEFKNECDSIKRINLFLQKKTS